LSSPPVHGTDHRHIPALDGLRGLAVLAVLFYHANGALTGGYLGVDLFFVLSGFLITSLLLGEHERKGRIDLKAFWIRRARRLFPALLLLMVAIALYARFVAAPRQLGGIRADALATLGYVANWHSIFADKSYWDLFTAQSPLEHTWSLAIEEQFYVVWPVVVALVLRRHSRRAVLVLAVALTGLSMAAMAVLFARSGASRAYLGTDVRASGILAGAALAAVLPSGVTLGPKAVRALDGLGLLAALGLGAAWLGLDGQDPLLYRGGFWLTELAALVLIVCGAMGPGGLAARALSLRPLTYLGKVSYGVYLWHWPLNLVLTAERIHIHGVWLHALRFAATMAVAAISYRFYEQPIRTRGLPFGRPLVVVPGAIAAVVALLVGATSPRSGAVRPVSLRPILPRIGSVVVEVRVMMFGDSTANSLGWALRGLRVPGLSVELRGQDGCEMLHDTCDGAQWIEHKKSLRPSATLVFLGGAFLYGRTFDGRWRKSCYPEWDRIFEETLTARLGSLTTVEGPVWAVTVPYPLGPYDSAGYRAEVDCINAAIRRATAAVAGVRILDLAEMLCPRGECQREGDGTAIRPDGVHYDIEASRALARQVLEQIQR
jgi:peptidoglycan/LPS O-acetylase OafA/YrhL